MQETQKMWIWFLGWEDPLEKEMATHSPVLSWEIPWTEEPDRLQSMGSQWVGLHWIAGHAPFSQKDMYLLNVSYVLSIGIYLGAKQWCEHECVSHLVVSNSLWSHGRYPTRLLCPWNSPGKNTGVDSHSRGSFPGDLPNSGIEHGSPVLQADSLPSESPGNPTNR